MNKIQILLAVALRKIEQAEFELVNIELFSVIIIEDVRGTECTGRVGAELRLR